MLRSPLGQPGMSQGQSRSSTHAQPRRRGYAPPIKPSRIGAARTRPIAESLHEYLALTIAVVGAAEQLYRTVGQPYPEQWESLERSAATFMDEFVVKWLAEGDPELKRAVTRQRRRKLVAHRGVLRLVESDRNKRARWGAVTLPQDAPIPITEEVAKAWAS
jgi:hypothetical protein